MREGERGEKEKGERRRRMNEGERREKEKNE